MGQKKHRIWWQALLWKAWTVRFWEFTIIEKWWAQHRSGRTLQGAEAAAQQQQMCKGLGLSLSAHSSSPAAGRATDRTVLALTLSYFCFPGQGLSSGKQDKIPGPQVFSRLPVVSVLAQQLVRPSKSSRKQPLKLLRFPSCLKNVPQHGQPGTGGQSTPLHPFVCGFGCLLFVFPSTSPN